MPANMKPSDRGARIRKRNKQIREQFDDLNKKEPNWKLESYLDTLAEKFFLAPDTIYSIVRGYYPEPKTD